MILEIDIAPGHPVSSVITGISKQLCATNAGIGEQNHDRTVAIGDFAGDIDRILERHIHAFGDVIDELLAVVDVPELVISITFILRKKLFCALCVRRVGI